MRFVARTRRRAGPSQTLRMGVIKALTATIALLGVASAARAADDPICAARPGKSTPACTVPAGHWQVETGLADWTLQKGGGERDTSLVDRRDDDQIWAERPLRHRGRRDAVAALDQPRPGLS